MFPVLYTLDPRDLLRHAWRMGALKQCIKIYHNATFSGKNSQIFLKGHSYSPYPASDGRGSAGLPSAPPTSNYFRCLCWVVYESQPPSNIAASENRVQISWMYSIRMSEVYSDAFIWIGDSFGLLSLPFYVAELQALRFSSALSSFVITGPPNGPVWFCWLASVVVCCLSSSVTLPAGGLLLRTKCHPHRCNELPRGAKKNSKSASE